MWSCPDRPYEYSFDTLRHALKHLRETFALVGRLVSFAASNGTASLESFDWGSVFTWPINLPLEFLALLEQHRVEAWVLVAHYAILVARITEVLWLDGFATNLVSTAALVVGQEKWKWITWPAAAVNVDLEEFRDSAKAAQQT